MLVRNLLLPVFGTVAAILLFWNVYHAPRPRAFRVGLLSDPSGTNELEPPAPRSASWFTHVVLSSDNRTFPGVLAAMKSTIVNAKEPFALRFYVLCGVHEKEALDRLIQCMLTLYKHPKLSRPLGQVISSYKIIEFNIKDYHPTWKIAYREHQNTSDRSAPNNYARLFLHEMLTRKEIVGALIPEKIVYLDTDVIVRGDIGELYRMALVNSSQPVAIPKRGIKLRNYRIVFGHPELVQWNRKYKGTPKEIDPELTAYNNGVYVQHLKRWKEQNVTSEILHWVDVNRRRKLYQFSFNPPFLLGLRGRVEPLPPEWNLLGFGDGVRHRREVLKKGKILHWTGTRKAWNKDGFSKSLWLPYHSPKCFPNDRLLGVTANSTASKA
eukprot:gb/GECG01014405.1/.p1 GENE.gb/GECG01014405.1/~~gb/GECG01014405.1/.p1  ORF type:complete len:381 (+),score=20.54 gb/GECG01014405.1/:1-1143(+)